jgi:drug/metabolite transporter (DMT)-like permease
MLTATILALVAAVLHAAWNLSVKQSISDRFLALWGQFFVAGVLSLVVLVAAGGIPARGYTFAAITGMAHIPYCLFLAKAYAIGDFSVAYPVARGGGALLAGIGGLLLLDDSMRPLGIAGMVVVAAGLLSLAGRGVSKQVIPALGVAAAIGVYSVADAKGIRTTDTPVYAAASFVGITVMTTTYSLATHRGPDMVVAMRRYWKRFTMMGIASSVTYALVQLAFRRAAVGYVTCLRESSVLIAAFVGARYLNEGQIARRVAGAAVVVLGLLLLVLGR